MKKQRLFPKRKGAVQPCKQSRFFMEYLSVFECPRRGGRGLSGPGRAGLKNRVISEKKRGFFQGSGATKYRKSTPYQQARERQAVRGGRPVRKILKFPTEQV